MTKNQEIKLELLKEFCNMDNPVEFCRKAYRFLTEDEVNSPTNSENSVKTNGIYIVYRNGQYFPFQKDMSKSFAIDVTGIGVVYDGHSFQVALQDIGEQTLIREGNNSSTNESSFYKTECEGLHDWDFVGATNHLRECGMDMPLQEGWYIPTLAVLEAMCFWKEKINEAIKFAGGKPMPNSYYWSSTETYYLGARGICFNSGLSIYSNKFYRYLVRPVSEF